MSSLPSPVIFIPGIMGSSLRDEYPVSPDTVWSVLKAATKAYDRITLHPDDLRFELLEPARVVKDGLFGMFYGEIIEELRYNLAETPDEPVPVYPFAYDWRHPLTITEKVLDGFIKEVIERTSLMRHYHQDGYTPQTGKVSLVAHSMGGLIAAGYVKTNGLDRIDKVATLASPFRGSLEAVAKTTVGIGGFGTSDGGSREREAARVTPALYHLLPSYKGAVLAEGDVLTDLFSAEAWQPSIVQTLELFVRRHGLNPDDAPDQARRLLAEMLIASRRHRTRLDRLSLPDSKRWLCVIGVDSKTRVSMVSRPDDAGAPFFDLPEPVNEYDHDTGDRTRTGDGTVPYFGARCAFVPTEEVICVSPDDFSFFEFKDKVISLLGFHSAIPNMNVVQRMVIAHLKGRPIRKGGGRPSPEIARDRWDPPIEGLK